MSDQHDPLLQNTPLTKSFAAIVFATVLGWASWVSLTLIEVEDLAHANRDVLQERSARLDEIFSELQSLEGEIENVATGQLETRSLIIDALDIMSGTGDGE